MSAHPVARLTPLRRVAQRGHRNAESALVCGDNLDVMARLGLSHRGRFRLAYVDPPYNTGRTFKEYKDARAPEEWRAMMRVRLELLSPLMAEAGTVVAEIDDTELGALIALFDDVFGRDNRVSIVTVVRSAATGHKAINRGPVNVADYLLVYAKDKRRFRPNAGYRRRDRDPAYGTVIADRAAPPETYTFQPLGRAVAEAMGYPSRLAATRALGRDVFAARVDRFCLDEPERVVRFAQPRYEAVSQEARALIDRSRLEPSRVFVLQREGFRPLILRGGNRLLFLSDKVKDHEGERCFVEPLTNVWDDIPFQGLAREGGVTFSRNKKPERLLARIVQLFSDVGDWVLDPFLGSGTTAAVAEKLGRKYVGIEGSQAVFDELCVPRLERVIAGKDAAGIRKVVGQGEAKSARGGFGIYA